MPQLDKAQAIVQHILRHVASPRRVPPGLSVAPATKPLVVGISGPQGIGEKPALRPAEARSSVHRKSHADHFFLFKIAFRKDDHHRQTRLDLNRSAS